MRFFGFVTVRELVATTGRTRPAAVCDEHSSTINCRRQEAGSYQARAARSPSLASCPTARPVQAVSADIQGAAWTGTVVHRRPLSTGHNRRQQTETPIRYSRRPRCLLLWHALWHPCICCGGS